ncbi:MAG TPA: RHS repeat-associated core domain-containing protein [Caulobacteraceae bacterium]|jgi:RHS repeat-associated protein
MQTDTASSVTTTFLYDGDNLSAEYNSAGAVLRRYVPSGLGEDQPLVWYEGSGTTSRRWLHADNQGSIAAYSDASGDQAAAYGYGPYGEPGAWSGSRYSYTGQLMIPESLLYNYKARAYDPGLGRFLQADPLGLSSGLNPYAYVDNTPLNATDPTGEVLVCSGGQPGGTVTGPDGVTQIGTPSARNCRDVDPSQLESLLGGGGGGGTAGIGGSNGASGTRSPPNSAPPQNVVDCLPGSSDAKVPVKSLLGDKTYLWPAPAANPNISFNGSTELGAAFLAGGTATFGTVRYMSSDGLRWGGPYINLAEARGFGASGGIVVQSSASSWGAFWGPGDGLTLPVGPYTSGTGTQNESGTNESVSAGVGTMAAYVNGSTGAAGCPTAIH